MLFLQFDKDSNNKLKNQWKGELIHNILAKTTFLYRCTPILPCHNTISFIITQRLSSAWNYFTIIQIRVCKQQAKHTLQSSLQLTVIQMIINSKREDAHQASKRACSPTLNITYWFIEVYRLNHKRYHTPIQRVFSSLQCNDFSRSYKVLWSVE